MNGDRARIRPYQRNDLDDLYSICLQTANGGEDGTPLFSDPVRSITRGGQRAPEFYWHVGLAELPADGARIFTMKRRSRCR